MIESVKRDCYSMLSEDEYEKVKRFRTETLKQKAFAVRVALRRELSQYCKNNQLPKIKPQDWQFELGEYGKPRLIESQLDKTGIQFNISHSGDYLLIGILHSKWRGSDILLGVDIERERQNTDINAIVGRYFSESEIVGLRKLPENKHRQRFFDLWTLKESYIKATGKGLATRLDAFGFEFDENNDSVALTPENEYAQFYWQSILKPCADGYRFAVSVATREYVPIELICDSANTFNLKTSVGHVLRLR